MKNKILSTVFSCAIGLGLSTNSAYVMESDANIENVIPTEIMLKIIPYCSGSLNNVSLINRNFSMYADESTQRFKPPKDKQFSVQPPYARFKNLITLYLSRDSVIDNGLLMLFPNIKKLHLCHIHDERYEGKYDYYRITDNGLNIPSLKMLDLYGNRRVTNRGLTNLPKLKFLILKSDYMISNDGLKCLPNLTKLDISDHSKITDEGLLLLPNLTALSLVSNKKITYGGLKGLKKLTALSLDDNIMIRDEDLKNLTNLTTLSLRRDSIITNDGLRELTNVTNLYLDGNKTITIDGLKCLFNLTSLSLCDNNMIQDKDLTYLPKFSELLPNLRKLQLRGNKLIKFNSLSSMPNLKELYVSKYVFGKNTYICGSQLELFCEAKKILLYKSEMSDYLFHVYD